MTIYVCNVMYIHIYVTFTLLFIYGMIVGVCEYLVIAI